MLRAELDAFADAIEQKRAFPVPEADVLAALAAFETALRSMQSGQGEMVISDPQTPISWP